MKRIVNLLCLILGAQVAGCASTANAAEQPRYYVYCNVYTPSACFGIASGDVMTMRVPIDFVAYDLVLVGGARLSIYSGYNPPRAVATDGSRPKKYSVPSGNYEYVLASQQRHVITYTPLDTGAPLLQIVIDQVEGSKSPRLAGFLKGFRHCRSDRRGLSCNEEDVLLEDVVQQVFD